MTREAMIDIELRLSWWFSRAQAVLVMLNHYRMLPDHWAYRVAKWLLLHGGCKYRVDKLTGWRRVGR